jgi:pantothenate kinase
VAGFANIIRSLRQSGEVHFPTFNRTRDRVVENGGSVQVSDETILVEGNYLLLDIHPWNELAACWDFSVLIDVPFCVMQERLIERWVRHGHTLKDATRRAEENDLPNARLVLEKALTADLTL